MIFRLAWGTLGSILSITAALLLYTGAREPPRWMDYPILIGLLLLNVSGWILAVTA